MIVVRVGIVLHLFSDGTVKICWCNEVCDTVYSHSHFTTPTDFDCDVRKQEQYNPHTHYNHPECIALKA